jgi:hypothetical protein
MASERLDAMPALRRSVNEFRALAASVSALATEFLAGLDDRPPVSPPRAPVYKKRPGVPP